MQSHGAAVDTDRTSDKDIAAGRTQGGLTTRQVDNRVSCHIPPGKRKCRPQTAGDGRRTGRGQQGKITGGVQAIVGAIRAGD